MHLGDSVRCVTDVMWVPQTEAELLGAIAAGMVSETHYLDFKREVGAKPADRAELARDLAQFAIDGGALIIGVQEDKENRRWLPVPQNLAGLRERFEQIANSQIDPPLPITIRELTSTDDPSLGYVVIRVPASPRAPHMVGGVYYGRGDTMRNKLSDAEVLRHHAARRDAASRINDLLQAEIDRDPIAAAGKGRLGHLYLVAQPEIDNETLALPLLDGAQDFQGEPHRTITFGAEQYVHQQVRRYAPTPGSASSTVVRSSGLAYCSQQLRDGRRYDTDRDDESSMIDIEVREDGGLRAFVGRITDEAGGGGGTAREFIILDGLAVAYAVRLVHWARMVSTLTGYGSSWMFGIAASGLQGCRSYVWLNDYSSSGPRYDRDDYRRTTTATLTEMTEHPGVVAKRLVGALLRGLGTAAVFEEALNYQLS